MTETEAEKCIMKRNNKIISLLGLLIFVLINQFTCVYAEKDQELLSQFRQTIKQYQLETGFLSTWKENDIERFVQIAQDTGFADYSEWDSTECINWWTPSHGIQYVFELVWGSRNNWSLEEQYDYAQYEVECGLTEETIVALPTDEDVKVGEARTKVQAAIRNKTGSIDFDNYTESIHFWVYPEPELGSTWVFEYYGENSITPAYSGYYFTGNGNIQVDIFDEFDLRNLYTEKCYAHEFKTFRWWTINEQYEFYELVVFLQQNQKGKYGYLPAFAQQILEHEYIMPTTDMIPPEQAKSIAVNYIIANQGNEPECNISNSVWISLYRITNNEVVYCIGLDSETSEENIIVLIDAFTGVMLKYRVL